MHVVSVVLNAPYSTNCLPERLVWKYVDATAPDKGLILLVLIIPLVLVIYCGSHMVGCAAGVLVQQGTEAPVVCHAEAPLRRFGHHVHRPHRCGLLLSTASLLYLPVRSHH